MNHIKLDFDFIIAGNSVLANDRGVVCLPTKNDVTFAKMGAVEKKVFQNLSSSGFKYSKSDIQEIAKQCNLTVVQVEVAMQLLSHKKLIP